MQATPRIDRERYKKPVVELDSISAFETQDLDDALYTMPLGSGRLDVLAEIRPGKPLVVFFGAAIPLTADRTLPWFAGTGLLTGRDASKVFISDPSLYLSERLNLAWYVGADGIDAQPAIRRVLERVVKAAAPTKVMCIGGSGGGFGALYYAGQFKDWLAVPWNPQTDIFAYTESAVLKYLRLAWKLHDIPAGKKHLLGKVDTDVFGLYSHSVQDGYAVYLQNETDSHVDEHLKPLLANYGISTPQSGKIGNKLYLQMANFGDGHAPPPRPYLSAVLDGLLQDERTWPAMFDEGAISTLLGSAGNTLATDLKSDT